MPGIFHAMLHTYSQQHEQLQLDYLATDWKEARGEISSFPVFVEDFVSSA